MEEAGRERCAPVDPVEFRKVLGRFASGITVITAVEAGETRGMTANAFVSVSLEPPLVLISVDRRARMNEALAAGRRYGVSILSEDQEVLSRHFAGQPQEGREVPFIVRDGIPVIEGAVACMVCDVVDIHPAGDHILYIGEVKDLDYRDDTPLVFYTGSYRNLQVQVIEEPFWW